MAVANLGDTVVATARNFIDGLADNITRHNALTRWAKKNGLIQVAEGGRTIVEPFLYGTNASLQWYDGFDLFTPPTTQEVLDGSEFNWKQLGCFISVSGRERRMNYGEHKRKDIAKTRIKQAQALMMNSLSSGLYADGTGSAGKELTGLQTMISNDPTAAGSYGGINQVANAFWRNKFSPAAATTSANVKTRMNSMYLQCLRGTDKPGLIVMDDDWYGWYWDSLQQLARFTDQGEADAGYGTLRFRNALAEYDDQCPDKRQYFLNPDNVAIRVASDRSFGFEVGDKRTVANGDYDVIPIFFMGNLTTGWRAGHGVNIAS